VIKILKSNRSARIKRSNFFKTIFKALYLNLIGICFFCRSLISKSIENMNISHQHEIEINSSVVYPSDTEGSSSSHLLYMETERIIPELPLESKVIDEHDCNFNKILPENIDTFQFFHFSNESTKNNNIVQNVNRTCQKRVLPNFVQYRPDGLLQIKYYKPYSNTSPKFGKIKAFCMNIINLKNLKNYLGLRLGYIDPRNSCNSRIKYQVKHVEVGTPAYCSHLFQVKVKRFKRNKIYRSLLFSARHVSYQNKRIRFHIDRFTY
jgi:hypothetical protein